MGRKAKNSLLARRNREYHREFSIIELNFPPSISKYIPLSFPFFNQFSTGTHAESRRIRVNGGTITKRARKIRKDGK